MRLKCLFCDGGKWYQCPDCILYLSLNDKKLLCYNAYKKLIYQFIAQSRKYRPFSFHTQIREKMGILRTLIGPIKNFKKYKYDPIVVEKFTMLKFSILLERIKKVTECYVYADAIELFHNNLLKLLWRETYTSMYKLNKRTDQYNVITNELVNRRNHITAWAGARIDLIECSNDL